MLPIGCRTRCAVVATLMSAALLLTPSGTLAADEVVQDNLCAVEAMDSLAGSQSWSDTPTYASCETPEPVPEAGEPVDVAKPTLATEPKQVASEQSTINDRSVEPAEYTDEDEPSQLDRAPADAAAEEPATDAVPAVEEPSDSPATADGATATTDTLSTDLAPADDPSPDAPPAVAEVVEELRDGLYEIIAGTSEVLRMDVTGGSSADGAHVQTWSSNDTIAQRWRLTRNMPPGTI